MRGGVAVAEAQGVGLPLGVLEGEVGGDGVNPGPLGDTLAVVETPSPVEVGKRGVADTEPVE